LYARIDHQFEDDEESGMVCELDDCLDKSENQLCGTIDHFTTFAIFLTGGGSGCDSNVYMFSKGWQDMILILGIVGILWVLLSSYCHL
jgi:hypothetical protein